MKRQLATCKRREERHLNIIKELEHKNFDLETQLNHVQMKNHLLEETLTKRNFKLETLENENEYMKHQIICDSLSYRR